MKHTLLLFLLAISFNSIAQEYEYVPFPMENAIWKTDMWGSVGCDQNTLFCEQFGVGTGATVIINDTAYIGVYPVNVQEGTLYPTLIAAIRTEEDSATKKIWIRATSGFYQNEILLYNFNLNVGDTIPFSSWSVYEGSGNQNVPKILTIAAIDTVLIDGFTRRRFHLLQDGLFVDTRIIEGIGSTSGLGPFCEFWRFEHWWDLQCFLLNGAFVYGQQFEQGYVDYLQSNHPDYQYCQSLTSIEESYDQLLNQVMVFPNPVIGSEFRVRCSGTPKTVTLRDLRGRKVLIRWNQIGEGLLVTGNFPQGINLIEVLTYNDQLIHTKILCQP